MNKHIVAWIAALLACMFMLPGCDKAETPPEDELRFDVATPTPAVTQRAAGMSADKLMLGEVCRFDWDGDGYLDEITFSTGEGGLDIALQYFDGTQVTSQIDLASVYDVYLYTSAAGNPCFIITGDMLVDEYATYLYRYDPEKQIKLASSMCGLVTALTPPVITLQTTCEALGSWVATRTFTIDDAFNLSDEEGMWELRQQGDRYLSVLRELEVEILKDGRYVKQTLLPGTELLPVATDANGLIRFQLKDGGEGQLTITTSPQGETLVNGEEEEACFGNLQYAG